jgi:D-alanine-D-alanine ligase
VYSIGHTIALTYNLKPPAPDPVPHRAQDGAPTMVHGGTDAVPCDFYSEFDSPSTIEAIASVLRAEGHQVHLVEATEELPRWFLTHPVDLVFNIAEGTHGAHRESQVPAILESLGIPFTGSGSLSLALALDKAKTKQVLVCEGLATPVRTRIGS